MQGHVRMPVVAGTFYPGDPDVLRSTVSRLLGEGPAVQAAHGSMGLVVPHAGYLYSGRVSGATFRRASGCGRPEVVILLGASHTGLGPTFSLSDAAAWRTPLGDVQLDREAIGALAAAGMRIYEPAFHREHSVEVQLPFLQVLWDDPVPIVPICVQPGPLEELAAAGATLLEATRGRVTWVVASSDFTHYEADSVARERDRVALDPILAVDAARFYRVCAENGFSICGVGAITTLLALASRKGWRESALVAYETSGDSTGDRAAVVGYAGVTLAQGGLSQCEA
ncbi:MAG: AmmeMemoRadiSam system protein B [Candidatus Bipolaricaulota bacterium]|nr:AmmeMemoRadiSam system protein B [Candidatus Bipolaricaulota bacterium]